MPATNSAIDSPAHQLVIPLQLSIKCTCIFTSEKRTQPMVFCLFVHQVTIFNPMDGFFGLPLSVLILSCRTPCSFGIAIFTFTQYCNTKWLTNHQTMQIQAGFVNLTEFFCIKFERASNLQASKNAISASMKSFFGPRFQVSVVPLEIRCWH